MCIEFSSGGWGTADLIGRDCLAPHGPGAATNTYFTTIGRDSEICLAHPVQRAAGKRPPEPRASRASQRQHLDVDLAVLRENDRCLATSAVEA